MRTGLTAEQRKAQRRERAMRVVAENPGLLTRTGAAAMMWYRKQDSLGTLRDLVGEGGILQRGRRLWPGGDVR